MPAQDNVNPMALHLGSGQGRVQRRIAALASQGAARRLWGKDPTLWFAEPAAEISDRLGWLDLPQRSSQSLEALQAFAAEVRRETDRVVLLGMGGSSLAPEVFSKVFGAGAGYPGLIVLDTTHPRAVRACAEGLDPARTCFVVSSKSGTTLETISLFRFFWHWAKRAGVDPGKRFMAVTDPGTPLRRLAEERHFRSLFLAPPDVGGRFSALSPFGLLPAALLGVELEALLWEAELMRRACGAQMREEENPGMLLGAALGEMAVAGRDKLTFFTSSSLSSFPDWLEQLIAESTGKQGRGILPVAGEPESARHGPDRLLIFLLLDGESPPPLLPRLERAGASAPPHLVIRLRTKESLGQELFRWEIATAIAGMILGIHPFNQPDVALAKALAEEAMRGTAEGASELIPTVDAADQVRLAGTLGNLLSQGSRGDYVSVHAYLSPEEAVRVGLHRLRQRLCERTELPVTVAFGPRLLHSTGQFHKGGPNKGLFLQLVDDAPEDLPVPESDYTFARLIRAQADGDYRALRSRGRRIVRVSLGADAQAGLERLGATI